ncbi:hypothetical protein Tco_0756054 [Tanacetum coccineum]
MGNRRGGVDGGGVQGFRQGILWDGILVDGVDSDGNDRAEFDAQITKQILKNDLQTKKPMSFLCTEHLQEHLAIKKRSCKDATTNRDSWLVSLMNVLNDKEVVIQLISLTDHICMNKNNGFLSKILDNLEGDEYGCDIRDLISAFVFGDEYSICSRVVIMERNGVLHAMLRQKLDDFVLSVYRKRIMLEISEVSEI